MTIELLKKTPLYQSLFVHSSIPIVVTDVHDRILDANEPYCTMLGYTCAELTALTLRDLVPPGKRPRGSSVTLSDLRTHGTDTFETEDLCKDGTTVPVEVTILQADIPGSLFFFSIIRDISRRKAAERKLRRNEQWYRFVFENAGVGLWEEDFSQVKKMVDTATEKGAQDIRSYIKDHPEFLLEALGAIKIISINEEALKIMEADSREQIIGALDAIFDKNELGVIEGELIAIAERQDEYSSEVHHTTLKGHKRIVLLKIKFPDDEEDFKHVVVSMMDITKLKETETSLIKALAEKRVLIKELYHRTKNNMQMIASFLSLQSAYTQNKRVHEIFDDMKNRIQSMSAVHEKLYQSGSLHSIHLNTYIDDIVNTLKTSYLAAGRSVSIEEEMTDVVIPLEKAIPTGIILNEIITNIFKHAFPENKKGIITISLHKSADNTVHLMLKDNGIGVPGEFDFRKHDSLGMKLVFALAEEQLQGSIRYSTVGGIAWFLDFPL